MEHTGDAPPAHEHPATRQRGVGIAIMGISLVTWWPAFTLGAWGVLFFDQLLTVWVAATAGLLIVALTPRSEARRWPHVLALSVPTVWLAIVLFGTQISSTYPGAIIDILGIVVGIAGIPFTLWTLTRVVWPEPFADFRLRTRVSVFAAVAVIAVTSFFLGVFHERFLVCEDFDVSGNSRPPGCALGVEQ